MDWIESNPDAAMEEFLMKKDELEKQVESILNKNISPGKLVNVTLLVLRFFFASFAKIKIACGKS